MEREQRRLVAIVSADVAGYSRLMEADEAGTLAMLKRHREELLDPKIKQFDGRVVGTAGDGILVEFPCVVDAVQCSVEVQQAMDDRNAVVPEDRRMELRIGVNLGDVIIDGETIYGDGVNVAARLEELAEPGGICLSATVREHIAGRLPYTFDDAGDHTVKNISRPVRVHTLRRERAGTSTSTRHQIEARELPLPSKPSVAVLPFSNMSGDPDQEYFSDGITEDIITELSRSRGLFVIARNSSFQFKGPAIDIAEVGRKLGVRYVVEGSVRKAGRRVRVTAQLIEAATGNHIWAERYDRDLEDIFAVQDEVTQNIVGAIEPEILLGEGRRVLRKAPTNLDAFDCCMRGLWHYYQLTPGDCGQAENWLQRAVALDPSMQQAFANLARVHGGRCWWGWSKDAADDAAKGFALAQRAVALDGRDPLARHILATTSMLSGRVREAAGEAHAAINLAPSYALGHLSLGGARIFLGEFAEALEPLQRCLRLSPQDPLAVSVLNRVAQAHYHLGNYEEAVHYAERALRGRRFYAVLRSLAASLGQLGRADEARAVLTEMASIAPPDLEGYLRVTNRYVDPAHRAHFEDGLRKAGMTS